MFKESLSNITCGETTAKPSDQQTNRRRAITFGLGAVVVSAEGFVFGDVRVEELERVLRHHALGDHLVIADDVGERQGDQAALGVWLHRVEL